MGLSILVHVIWSLLMAFPEVSASENIALGRVTRQSSFRDGWDSSKAVDGCLLTYIASNCCTHTVNGHTEAWWQVDLQTLSVIDSVNITYRDYGDTLSRLAGYEIYLSNTSDWTSGTRCHKDTTADLASMSVIQNIQCPGVAQYLTIYNDRRVKDKLWYSDDAVLELCEVQVYGCPVGRYGNGNCNNDCTNCVNDMCDTTSGTCGECTGGYYQVGATCTPCPAICRGNACDSISGACSDCHDGFYGPTCTPCPSGCSTDTCDKTSGHCNQCKLGFYGSFCNQSCPVNCKHNVCNKNNAQCTDCVEGFYGSFCDQLCPSNCKNTVCHKDNGQCTGCNDGFYGLFCIPCPNGCGTDTCDETSGYCLQCSIGLHGSFCNQSCPVNCKNNVCNTDNGQCQECEMGSYGYFCNQTCPADCRNSVCYIENGQCTECEAGLFGSGCNQSCPVKCQDTLCHRSTGECAVCAAGFYGNKCLTSCGSCQGVRCDQDTGVCATGCTDGWTGDKCDTKVVVISNDEALHATTGTSIGFGVVILALVIVIIVQARRLTLKRNETTDAAHMTDLSLSRTAKELYIDQDKTYDEIVTHNSEQTTAQGSHNDGNYEQLGHMEVEVPHIYDKTGVNKKA